MQEYALIRSGGCRICNWAKQACHQSHGISQSLSLGAQGRHVGGHSPASSVGQSPGCQFIMVRLVWLGVHIGLTSFEKTGDEIQAT